MSLEAIDQLLDAWQERLARIDENLLALEADPTYQVLSGSATGRRAPLEGTTKTRVTPALDALSQLFEHRERLTEVLDRAREVRASISAITFWNTDEKLREVQALLHGPSIKMGTVPMPLATRNLLDPAARDVAVVPEELLAAMARAYEVARDAVAAVHRAWETLEPSIEIAERQANELRACAKSLSLAVDDATERELSAALRDLAAARKHVACDPLGAAGGIEAVLAPRLAAIAASLSTQAAQRDRVMTSLATARSIRARLDEAHTRARTALEQVARDFVETEGLPASTADAELAALDPWLEKLDATVRAHHWRAAEVGLARWHEAAGAYLAADDAVGRAIEGLVARRAELSGRLSARMAQARALVSRGTALDASAEALAHEAEAMLRARPTSLYAAAALVDRYESLVARSRTHS